MIKAVEYLTRRGTEGEQDENEESTSDEQLFE
jgi:hypothetical protein